MCELVRVSREIHYTNTNSMRYDNKLRLRVQMGTGMGMLLKIKVLVVAPTPTKPILIPSLSILALVSNKLNRNTPKRPCISGVQAPPGALAAHEAHRLAVPVLR